VLLTMSEYPESQKPGIVVGNMSDRFWMYYSTMGFDPIDMLLNVIDWAQDTIVRFEDEANDE
jgi:hypothetical protein